MVTREKKKKKPFLVLDIELGGGKVYLYIYTHI